MATRFALALRSRPALLAVVAVIMAVAGASTGHGMFGLWDGPI